MKTLYYDSYHYLGVSNGWHVFECTKSGFDREVLFLYRARMIMEDGSSLFYDPICPESALTLDLESAESRRNRMAAAYAKAISQSASVKPSRRVGHIPK